MSVWEQEMTLMLTGSVEQTHNSEASRDHLLSPALLIRAACA